MLILMQKRLGLKSLRTVTINYGDAQMNSELSAMRNMELKLLIIEYNKASQLDRSFSKTKLSSQKKYEFRKTLIKYCIELMENADKGTLKNKDIRDRIKALSCIDSKNISYGQAQKVINVSLKQYCFILGKENLIKELDCPLDTTTMKGYKIAHKRMIDVTEADYIQYQQIFEEENNGIRILKDSKYDDMRINEFIPVS